MANLGDARRDRTGDDLSLLEAVVELAKIPVHVPAARAFQHVYGRLPGPSDMRRLRRSISRLVRDGLVQAAVSLDLSPTPDGRIAVELLRFKRLVGLSPRAAAPAEAASEPPDDDLGRPEPARAAG